MILLENHWSVKYHKCVILRLTIWQNVEVVLFTCSYMLTYYLQIMVNKCCYSNWNIPNKFADDLAIYITIHPKHIQTVRAVFSFHYIFYFHMDDLYECPCLDIPSVVHHLFLCHRPSLSSWWLKTCVPADFVTRCLCIINGFILTQIIDIFLNNYESSSK